MSNLLLLVWEVTCLALFWSVFCRSVLVGPGTRRDIRLALLLCGLASILGIAAPLYGWQPTLIGCMVLGGNVIWQIVVSRHWADFIAYQIFSKDDLSGPVVEGDC